MHNDLTHVDPFPNYSTPNQIGGGVQTKISHFLKNQVGHGKATKQPLGVANDNKLNNR